MIKVNLVPNEYLLKQRQRNQMTRAFGVVALVAVGFAVLSVLHVRRALESESLLQEKQTKLRQLQTTVDKVKELENIKSSVQAHLDALEGLIVTRYRYPLLMQDIARRLPPTVWLSNISTTLRPDGAIDVRLMSGARVGEDVAGFVANLENSEKFADPVLGPVNVTESQNVKLYNFPVNFTYKAAVK